MSYTLPRIAVLYFRHFVMSRLKIIVSSVLLVAACLWLGFQGYGRAKTYYLTVQELLNAPASSRGKALRVGGDVKPGSVQKGTQMRFELAQGNLTLPVLYVGTDPLPDTFRDSAQAVVDGRYDLDQKVFLADKIQAKCASKYESKGERRVSSFQPPQTATQPLPLPGPPLTKGREEDHG